MSNYATWSVPKNIVPLKKGFRHFQHTEISKKAEKRLKWMDYIDSGKTIAQASRHFDQPYTTVKFWRDRYNRYDLNSLDNKSSRPKKVNTSKLTNDEKALIIHCRTYDLPGAGKKTLQRYIQNEYKLTFGQSAIQRVINQAKLKRIKKPRQGIKQRVNRKHMYSVPKQYKQIPGGLVYLDVKHLRIGLKKYYQFTALDHATRIMKAKIYRRITSESTVKFMDYLQKEFPFKDIRYIGTDNGSEFLGDLTEYEKEKKLEHVFSSPASPKQNPYVERVIRTIKDDLFDQFGLEDTVELQQEALDDYVYTYNYKRPHQGINLLTPIEMYVKLVGTI